MGFNANQAKVNRQGDYDAEVIMRAVDDENFSRLNLPQEAALKMIAVRGNPLLFFTAIQLPKIELALYAAGGLTHEPGTINIAGREIGYDVITGPYPDGKTRTFALFYPGNSATYKSSPASIQELDFSNNQGTNYFALATLPAGAVDNGTLQKLAASAFSFPTDSQVTYSWDQASNTVTETYRLITSNVLGLPEAAVSGLLPHHYQPSPVHNNDQILAAGPSALNPLRYDTPRGELRVYDSGTFTCRYPYPGVLPFMPGLDASDTDGKAQLDKWKDVFQLRHASHNPPYTDMNSGRGQSVYNLGKFLGRNMWAAASLRVNDPAYAGIAANVTTATREGLELFFRENPVITSQLNEGQAPYYTLYDSRVGTLNQYPNGLGASTNFPSDSTEAPWDDFGALSRCNDHHFHYGYFIHAAAQVALQDPAWGARYKDAINQMVFDVANNSKINPSPILKFPKERFWDAYENRGMASGMTFGDVIGNNEESISEHINFWTGTILWAAATGQQAMMEDAICHHAAAVHTSWTYWFDPAGNYNSFMSKIRGAGFDPNWAGNGVARIFDAFSRWDTFFGIHPVNARGIVIIPVTPASFYHAMNPAYVTKMLTDYTNFVTKFDINPLKPNGVPPQKDENGRDVGFFTPDNQWERGLYWYAHFAKYWALANPDTGSNDVNADAIKRFWNVFPDYVRVQGTKDPTQFIIPQVDTVDVGDSGLLTYHMIRYMQKKGAVDTWVRATNTPFFASFFNATTGKRTYVGFNPTNAPLTITFDDGGSIPNVAPRSLGSFTQP
jgi:hypothetical protein